MLNKRTLTSMALGGLLLVLSAGCENSNPNYQYGDEFPAEDASRPPVRFTDVQASAGARDDAMLYPHHFDGGKLNSLGQQKLTAMMKDDAAVTPMVVYINLPKDDASLAARKESVSMWLKDAGLLDDQIKLVDGPNPGSTGWAAPGIANMGKTDSDGGGEATADPAVVTGSH